PEAVITGLARLTRDGQLPMNWSKWDEKLLSHPSTLRRAARIARRSGITRERLSELLDPPAEPEECYSLAAGSSAVQEVTIPQNALTAEKGKGSKNRTGYSVAPLVLGLLSSCLLLGFPLLEPEMFGSNQSPLAYPTGLYFLTGAMLIWVMTTALSARSLKRKLSQGLTSPLTFASATADQFPGLDSASLAAFTLELEGLGFRVKGDYRVDSGSSDDSLKQFWRVGVSNEYNCWVRINQVVAGTLGVTKVSYSLVSELADGYAVYTTNAEPLAIVYASQ